MDTSNGLNNSSEKAQAPYSELDEIKSKLNETVLSDKDDIEDEFYAIRSMN